MINTTQDLSEFVDKAKSAMTDVIPNIVANSGIGSNKWKKKEEKLSSYIMKLKALENSFNPESEESCMSKKTANKVEDQISLEYIEGKTTPVANKTVQSPSSAAAVSTVTYLVEDTFALIADDDGTKIIID